MLLKNHCKSFIFRNVRGRSYFEYKGKIDLISRNLRFQSNFQASNFTIVQEPISSSDEDVAEESSPSSVTETLFIPVIDLQSDPKPVKPKTYPEKSQGPREIPIPGRKRKRKSDSVEVDKTGVIEILSESVGINTGIQILTQNFRIIQLLQEVETNRKKKEEIKI